jgi:hypothetical protein
LFLQFSVGLAPLQKLHEVLKDPFVSPNNPHQSEVVHYVDEKEKCYGICYKEFLRHHYNRYMGCEVINGFMSLLEEKFNNEGKNKFFPHQFFYTVLDEKISRLKKGEPSKLTKMVNSDSNKNN